MKACTRLRINNLSYKTIFVFWYMCPVQIGNVKEGRQGRITLSIGVVTYSYISEQAPVEPENASTPSTPIV